MKLSLSSLSDLKQLIKELSVGLKRLSFADNFISFQTSVSITAGAELRVLNELPDSIPSTMVINYQEGNGLITASGTPWNRNYLYLKNNGASNVEAVITFFK